MQINNKQLAQILKQGTYNVKGERQSKFIKKFALYLMKNNLLSQTPAIVCQFQKLLKEKAHMVKATVETKNKLSKSTRIKFVNLIQKHLGKAKKINLKEIVNKKMLGGYVLRFNDKIIDERIENKIKKLF